MFTNKKEKILIYVKGLRRIELKLKDDKWKLVHDLMQRLELIEELLKSSKYRILLFYLNSVKDENTRNELNSLVGEFESS